MTHKMKLQKQAFERIRRGEKIIELRLCDEKRQKVKVGDVVEFSSLEEPDEKITAKVKGLLYYKTFKDLINDIPATYFGFTEEDKPWLVESMYDIYSKEKEEALGVLGIRIEVIK